MLEMDRVMATRHFASTIAFMAVAGEEEGLYGSDFFARNANAQGMDIEGMLNNDIIGSGHGRSRSEEPVHDPPVVGGRANRGDAAAGRRPRERRR
jgi:Zn-dependent M28 family amino/carboxypeptidase